MARIALTDFTPPSKVLAIGLNYADHARESGMAPPKNPLLFVKTNNSICYDGDTITWSADASTTVDYEAELAVVIGRQAKNVSEADALDYVYGYTCCNDVSARDEQFADQKWVRAKSFDTFCPLGPSIVTADEIGDPQNLRIMCRVNGETLQDSNTSEMIFGVAHLIAYLSRYMDSGGTWRYRYIVTASVNHNAYLNYAFPRSRERKLLKDLSLRVGVNNVFDAEPPLADEDYGYRRGAATNPRGRAFYAQATKRF